MSLIDTMRGCDSRAAVQAALDSGLLPTELIERWCTTMVERMIRSTVQQKSECPDWYRWAYKWLNNLDRSSESALLACDLAWGWRLRVGAAEAAEAAFEAAEGDAMGVFNWASHYYEDLVENHKLLWDLIEKDMSLRDIKNNRS